MTPVAQPPNLLVIMADQLRHDWLSREGTEGVKTPCIDAFAARGKVFTQACTNSAICVPARMSLATGRSPERLGALGNDAQLAVDARTHYQQLRDHDYRVGVVGKLDLAKSAKDNGERGDRPATFRWGFTHPVEAEGKMHAGQSERPLGPYGHWLEERGLYAPFTADYQKRFRRLRAGGDDLGGAPPQTPYANDDLYRDSLLPATAFEDHWIGQRAIQWIREVERDYPWHLFVSFVGPHDPFDPPSEWAERFRDAPMPAPIPADGVGKPGNVSPSVWTLTEDEIHIARRQYTAATALIDEQVGKILDALQQTGAAAHTYVVVTSDHGEMLGDHGLFQKSVPYEAAIRIPLMVTGPGITPGTSDSPVELADLGPTLAELAGCDPLPDLDARSFTPLLFDQSPGQHRRVTVTSQPHYIAIRSPDAKYVRTIHSHPRGRPSDPDEAYDLATDPTEQHNLMITDLAFGERIRDELVAAARADGQPLDRLGES